MTAVAVSVAALCLVVVAGYGLPNSSPRGPLPVANAGFELAGPVPFASQQLAAWYGDSAAIVEQQADVVPFEGQRMLQFMQLDDRTEQPCELYQIIDLAMLPERPGSGVISVEASAFFNAARADVDDDCVFGIAIFACSRETQVAPGDSPFQWEQPMAFSGNQSEADQDATSWQEVNTRLQIPAETRYIAVRLIATGATRRADGSHRPPPGLFADNVSVRIVKST